VENYKSILAIVFFFLFPYILQAHEADPFLNAEKAKYASKPSYKGDYVDFIEPYDVNYAPYEDCKEPHYFKITNLAMKLQYRFVSKKELDNWVYQYDCQFHVVKIDYEITCRNKLAYNGTEYLTSQSKISNNATPGHGEIGERMAREAYDWIENLLPEEYINADGSITKDANSNDVWPHYTIVTKVDTNAILNKWVDQKVAYPEYTFMGTPGKLPRPVLLIHGLDSDYKVWGVEPDIAEFKNGKVKKYEYGSLPDMLARSNNLYTENKDSTIDGKKYSINSNGIYFFQSPRNDKGEDVNPHWINKDVVNSQSYALYKKIEDVMNDFYKEKLGIDWWESDKYQIDLVGHSQGGLVIREMLRGLRDTPDTKQGNENAANHINRVITVNTPHFGSALATDASNLSSIEETFSGVAAIIRDIENPIEHTLVKANVNVDFWEKFGGVYENLGILGEALLEIPVVNILGFAFISGIAAATDVTLTIKGPYLGTYVPEAFIDVPGPWNQTKTFPSIETVAGFKDRLAKPRKSGYYLDKNDDFMIRLNADGFPKRPDGKKITMLPMYSDSTDKILPMLFEMAGETANKLCSQGDSDPNCFAIGVVLKNYVKNYTGYSISKPEFDKGLWDALLNIQNGWLVHGDAVVEASSQKFVNNSNKPDNEYFLEPRKYAIHNALAPWEPVLHGPFGNFKGAPQQGFDLLCALSPACDKAFATAQGNSNSVFYLSEMIYKGEFNERTLDVVGNFDLTPTFISEGTQAFSISANGESIATAIYEPGKGSSIILKYDGIEQTYLLLGPEIATQPSMARKGDSIYVIFTNYSGKPFQEVYFLPGLSNILTATVVANGSAMSPVIIGNATVANSETQKPPTPPLGHRLAPVTLAILHREARGEHESNTCRPRFLVYNTTNDTLEFSKVAYYFTADQARIPKVVVDYPYVSVSVENLGGDQWRFVFDVGNQKIAPKTFYPSADGWQIRIHYSDWYEYKHLDDWSADYSLGIVKANRKIVIYDKNGKIIWGNEAPGFESEDNGIIPAPKGTIAWKDDAPWETNTFKPRVTVKNTGSVALSDYHAQLWFRIPQGGKSLSPLDVWYAPESSPSVKSVKNAGGRVWILDMHFGEHILYSGDSVSEGNIGLHLTDWSKFDKTVCGIVLKDKDGNTLFGKEPSVAECENYDGPNLLLPLYSLI